MSRLFIHAISAWSFLCASASFADIPMVATALLPSHSNALPALPATPFHRFEAVRVSVRGDTPMALDTSHQSDVSAFGTACSMSVSAKTRPDAMIEVSVNAPCASHAPIIVTHNRLSFHGDVSLTGVGSVTFPALATDADISVTVASEQTLFRLDIPEFDSFARVVLQSEDRDPVQIDSSTLTSYEADGVLILSADLRDVAQLKVHRLTVLRAVTAQNCDGPLQSDLRIYWPKRPTHYQTLRFAAVDCSRAGDIQRLKNIVQDLRLASN